MADRADYLARTLTTRLAQLHRRFAEDRLGEPDRRQRIEIIEKVLATELGVTNSATLALIESAAPSVRSDAHGTHRELTAFADFLRQPLATELASTT